MTYTEFASRAAALGYRVFINDYGMARVQNNNGLDLAIVYSDIPYDFQLWIAWETSDWGSEAKRMLLTRMTVQFASTAIKNRGKIPDRFKERQEA